MLPIMKHFSSRFKYIITARDFSETVPLLKKNGIDPYVFGNHKGKSRIRKIMGVVERDYLLMRHLPNYDFCMCVGGINAAHISYLRKKPIITFGDNNASDGFFNFPQHFFCPEIIIARGRDISGFSNTQITTYNGYKEDIYISNFRPDKNFLKQIPFKEYIVVRPENLKADYVKEGSVSLVPELLDSLSRKGFNIIYFPRYRDEIKYAKGLDNVYIPSSPLDGLNTCYYAKAVLTGAGTFAREAAILGTPALSFYPGKFLLEVDKSLINKGRLFHTRKIGEITNFISSAKRHRLDLQRSEKAFVDLVSKLENLISTI